MLPPERRLASITKLIPSYWKEVDACRDGRWRTWPDWCFLPRDELMTIVEPRLPADESKDHRVRRIRWIKMATILTPWRVSKGVYRFDPDIYQSLIKTSLRGPLPVELFFNLPQWAVYIETPDLDTYDLGKSPGFVASLNYSSLHHNEAMLNIISLSDGDRSFIQWLFLREGFTIEESLAEFTERSNRMYAEMKLSRPRPELILEEVVPHVTKLLNLLLYICQTDPEYRDIRCADGSDRLPGNPWPRKTKKGRRYFPPDKPTIWECGFRQGSEIRRAISEQSESLGGTHRSPIPHTRAAHWHTYIVGKGSRKDPSKGKRVLKWIHTILVNAPKGDAGLSLVSEDD